MTEWLDAATAARRLGVKPATLYSYVSRGVLTRRRAPAGRGSRFDAGEVEALARRGRPRRRRLPGDLAIESAITEISGSRLAFRGQEAVALAAECSLEEVAVLLWTGTLPGAAGPAGGGELAGGDGQAGGGGAGGGWQAAPAAVAAGTAAQAGLPPGTLPLERLQVIVPALAAADPFRLHLEPPAVMAAARSLMAGMVDCLPATGSGPGNGHGAGPSAAAGGAAEGAGPADGGPAGGSADVIGGAGGGGGSDIAGRLWRKLCPRPPGPGLLAVLSSALVLLADHELAPSTFAARVAASVQADPYAVVATGLGALGGALHGGACLGAEAMLAAAGEPADAPRVVGDLLRRGERIPGFGHLVYAGSDPRAGFLLDAVRAAAGGSPRLAVAEAVAAEVARRGLPQPNIDFALATLASAAGMTRGAGEAVFAVARAAGWVAHALEEYERRVPLRPRATYPGNPGGADRIVT